MIDTGGTLHSIATTAEAAVIGGSSVVGSDECIVLSELSTYNCKLKTIVPSTTNYLSYQLVEWYDICRADCTVTFYNEGTLVETRTVIAGNTLGTLPTSPTKTGYTFNGWKDSGGTIASSSTIINNDTRYDALWVAKLYTFTLLSNTNFCDCEYNVSGTIYTSDTTIGVDGGEIINIVIKPKSEYEQYYDNDGNLQTTGEGVRYKYTTSFTSGLTQSDYSIISQTSDEIIIQVIMPYNNVAIKPSFDSSSTATVVNVETFGPMTLSTGDTSPVHSNSFEYVEETHVGGTIKTVGFFPKSYNDSSYVTGNFSITIILVGSQYTLAYNTAFNWSTVGTDAILSCTPPNGYHFVRWQIDRSKTGLDPGGKGGSGWHGLLQYSDGTFADDYFYKHFGVIYTSNPAKILMPKYNISIIPIVEPD